MLTSEEKKRIFFDAFINFEGQFNADFLMKLLFGKANPDHVISDEVLRSSKLHVAVISENCSSALVRNIIAEDFSQLNQKNIFQVSPLHRAVYCAKNLDVVAELLQQGAYVNAVERSMMSALHIVACNNNKYQHDLLQILIEYGGNVNCVDYKEQTPLHMLVKGHVVQEQSLHLLLQNGANPNACDKDNNSIFHVAIQNPHISLNVLKTLLTFGARPECELKNCFEKMPIAKLLIQFIAVKSIETLFEYITEGSFGLLPNEFIDLSSSWKTSSHLELSTFRDNCINELMAMRKINVNQSYTLFKFISERCSNARLRDCEKNVSLLENALLSLNYDKFSYCNDLIDASFELSDIINILSEQGVYSSNLENATENKVYLNYYTIINLASYLNKSDLVNLAVAYVNKSNLRNQMKKRMRISKPIKRIGEGLCDSMVCMKRLKL